MLLIFIGLLLGTVLSIAIIGSLLSGPVYRGPISNHFDGKHFLNIGGAKAKGFKDLLKWIRTSSKRPKWNFINSAICTTPIERFDSNGQAKIFFVNHSTFLIQVDGINILTDPIWSTYASPFQFAGPKRMRPPGISFEALPNIDIVLLSHNHYDHLDLPLLKKLHRRFQPKIICPLGVDLFLNKKGFKDVIVMDWWDETELNGLRIQATPAQHFSARGLFDQDRTLWCGYVIRNEALKIYFVGDTGYGPIFNEIGSSLGPFDICMIPIGAYQPRWFMGPIHCDPEQAIQIHHEIKSRRSIACHYGTFPLAIDGQTEPVDELFALTSYQEVKETFLVLPEGKSIVVGTSE